MARDYNWNGENVRATITEVHIDVARNSADVVLQRVNKATFTSLPPIRIHLKGESFAAVALSYEGGMREDIWAALETHHLGAVIDAPEEDVPVVPLTTVEDAFLPGPLEPDFDAEQVVVELTEDGNVGNIIEPGAPVAK